jgi:LemA protein
MRALLVIIGIVILFAVLIGSSYNKFVTADENVKSKWAVVESQYQRRTDLIPNIVSTVKGAAEFEKSTLTEVIEARAKATSIQVDANNLTPEAINNFQQVQNGVSSALSRLLVTVENYPQLKANQNFLELQSQLEGTENRIAVARNDFNSSVQGYNALTRAFPGVFIARLLGFTPKAYFEAQAGAESAPKVQF